jgi:hypothetical protein
MIVSLARTVETELSSAMSSAITGLVDGTKTAQEAFADMFAGIGKAFIDMATQMIAKALVMKAVGVFTGGTGTGGLFTGNLFGAGGVSGIGGGMVSPFADGGRPATGEVSLIGERGPELWVPDSPGRVVSNSQTKDALGQYSAGNNSTASNGVVPTFKLETTVINGVEYATVDQVAQMGAIATKNGAKQGEARAMNSLKNSRGARSRIGI